MSMCHAQTWSQEDWVKTTIQGASHNAGWVSVGGGRQGWQLGKADTSQPPTHTLPVVSLWRRWGLASSSHS